MQVNSAGDDHVLLARIAGGDQVALSLLYDAYSSRLAGYLWHQLDQNTGCVEEALQDTFLAVWRSAVQFRGESLVAAWIFQIAHRVALNMHRQQQHRVEGRHLLVPLTSDDANHDGALGLPSYEDAVIDRLWVTDALMHLSPKHREVLDLAYYQGFTLEEIARIIDVPLGTVKSRLSLARQALSNVLAHTAEEPIHE